MNIKTIYYRGFLRSCNYKCSYCPFRFSDSDLSADEAALNRFCERINEKVIELTSDLTVMLIPHGEAMIHAYYHRAIASLCTNEHVRMVGCQTNLSFDIEKFAECIKDYTSKIGLWCTFHPSQVSIDDFLLQCEQLIAYGIMFSVGAVGCPEDIPLLKELRCRLHEKVYMWINALEGFKMDYTKEEIKAFSEIDPLFWLELEDFPADPEYCTAGRESIFVRGGGDYYACNISKVRLGNIYKDEQNHICIPKSNEQTRICRLRTNEQTRICRSKTCGCYLAYSNRTEMRDIFLSKAVIPARTPNAKKAVFFDIDGTLTDCSGVIPDENVAAVKELSEHNLIFLATSRPYQSAKHICEHIWDYLAGGAFAEGSDIRIFDCGLKEIIPLDEAMLALLPSGTEYVCYREDETLHKITVVSGYVPDSGDFNIIRDEVTGIVSKSASKLNGVLCICKRLGLLSDHVTVVGNSENDVPMLRFFRNSVAVTDADESAKSAARFMCNIKELK